MSVLWRSGESTGGWNTEGISSSALFVNAIIYTGPPSHLLLVLFSFFHGGLSTRLDLLSTEGRWSAVDHVMTRQLAAYKYGRQISA